jgi:hypothetical protein
MLVGPVHQDEVRTRSSWRELARSNIHTSTTALPIAVIPEDQFLTPSRHARLPDVVKCVPLSVSTLWILNGTAVTRRRRKSAAVLRATFSCTSTKANLEGAVDRDEQVELALRGSNFG